MPLHSQPHETKPNKPINTRSSSMMMMINDNTNIQQPTNHHNKHQKQTAPNHIMRTADDDDDDDDDDDNIKSSRPSKRRTQSMYGVGAASSFWSRATRSAASIIGAAGTKTMKQTPHPAAAAALPTTTTSDEDIVITIQAGDTIREPLVCVRRDAGACDRSYYRWYRVGTSSNHRELLQGVNGNTYQASVDDIGSRICCEWITPERIYEAQIATPALDSALMAMADSLLGGTAKLQVSAASSGLHRYDAKIIDNIVYFTSITATCSRSPAPLPDTIRLTQHSRVVLSASDYQLMNIIIQDHHQHLNQCSLRFKSARGRDAFALAVRSSIRSLKGDVLTLSISVIDTAVCSDAVPAASNTSNTRLIEHEVLRLKKQLTLKNHEIQSSVRSISELKRQLSEALVEHESTSADLSMLKDTLQGMAVSNSHSSQREKEMIDHIDELEYMYSSANQHVERLESEVDKLKQEMVKLSDENEALVLQGQQDRRQAKADREKAQSMHIHLTNLQDAHAQANEFRETLDVVRDDRDRLKIELEHADAQLFVRGQAAEQEIHRVSEIVLNQQNEIIRNKKTINELKQDLLKVKNQLERLHRLDEKKMAIRDDTASIKQTNNREHQAQRRIDAADSDARRWKHERDKAVEHAKQANDEADKLKQRILVISNERDEAIAQRNAFRNKAQSLQKHLQRSPPPPSQPRAAAAAAAAASMISSPQPDLRHHCHNLQAKLNEKDAELDAYRSVFETQLRRSRSVGGGGGDAASEESWKKQAQQLQILVNRMSQEVIRYQREIEHLNGQ